MFGANKEEKDEIPSNASTSSEFSAKSGVTPILKNHFRIFFISFLVSFEICELESLTSELIKTFETLSQQSVVKEKIKLVPC